MLATLTSRRSGEALAGRGALFLPAIALLVHELRYLLAYGKQTDAALAAQGHGYVDSLAPWLVLLLALAVGQVLTRIARATAGRAGTSRRRSFASLWLLGSLSLYGIFAVQETLEGIFASGHPGGLGALFAHGGWWALAVAVVLGAGLAALLRLADCVVELARRLCSHVRWTRGRANVLRLRSVVPVAYGVLASSAAGRAPPVP